MTSTALDHEPGPTPHRPSPLGLPITAVAVLAALAVPRAIAHDLAVLPANGLADVALSVGPLVVWVVVAVIASRRPLGTLIAAGVGYGIALGLVHNLAWSTVWGEDPPRLGGALAGAWPPATEELLLRGATGLSSLGTGAMIGLLTGLVAWGLQEVARRTGARLPLR
jgi:hypothetical protein